MKISDLQNYEIPTENHKHKINIFKQKTKLPFFTKIKHHTIDFTICNIIRSFITIALFKFLSRNVPESAITQLAKTTTNKEMLLIIVTNNLHTHLILSIMLSFIIGSFYYIIMQAHCPFGTIGMKASNLKMQTKTGNSPNIFQTFIWYYCKIMYPICLILAIFIFYTKGTTVLFWMLAIIIFLFSDTLPMIFGTQPLYEKLSGTKIAKK